MHAFMRTSGQHFCYLQHACKRSSLMLGALAAQVWVALASDNHVVCYDPESGQSSVMQTLHVSFRALCWLQVTIHLQAVLTASAACMPAVRDQSHLTRCSMCLASFHTR